MKTYREKACHVLLLLYWSCCYIHTYIIYIYLYLLSEKRRARNKARYMAEHSEKVYKWEKETGKKAPAHVSYISSTIDILYGRVGSLWPAVIPCAPDFLPVLLPHLPCNSSPLLTPSSGCYLEYFLRWFSDNSPFWYPSYSFVTKFLSSFFRPILWAAVADMLILKRLVELLSLFPLLYSETV